MFSTEVDHYVFYRQVYGFDFVKREQVQWETVIHHMVIGWEDKLEEVVGKKFFRKTPEGLEFWLSEIYGIKNLSTERYHSKARIRKYLSVQCLVIQYGIICLMTTNSWDSAFKSNKKVLRMFHWEILWIYTDIIKLQNLTQANAQFSRSLTLAQ